MLYKKSFFYGVALQQFPIIFRKQILHNRKQNIANFLS